MFRFVRVMMNMQSANAMGNGYLLRAYIVIRFLRVRKNLTA